MTSFLLKRLAAMIVVVVGVSFLIFALLELTPGSTVAALLGSKPHTPEAVQAITNEYHLNDPFLVQYWHWVTGVLTGDLGTSVQSGQSVASLIGERLPVTLELAGATLVVVLLTGIPVGFLAGVRRGKLLDRGVSVVSVLALSAPGFTVGILLIYVFGVKLGWLPVFGGGTGFVDTVVHLVLPVVALSVGIFGLVARQTRAAVRNVMDQDYVTFALARGLPPWRILIPYALRNTALPILTIAGLLAIGLLAGTVLAEQVFSLPGIGSLLVSSIQSKDIPVAQGVSVMIALAVVLINLVMDLLVLVLDPRTRHPVGA